jgi:predicted ATPase/class 3 adenylate cyclase/Tfp pilus assembly protein PilF
MPDLPRGTVAFLFTDIEGSTQRWERDSAGMRMVVERHLVLLDEAISTHHGVHFKTIGDAVQAAFATAPEAVAAALAAQLALERESWGAFGPLRVRMALHVGAAEPRDGDYLAPALNRLSRLLATGHGGQILLTRAAADLARDTLPTLASLRHLGEHRLRDLQHPEPVFQLLHPDLEDAFPPLRSLDIERHNLPPQPTAFIGRATDVRELIERLQQRDVRLLTLTGPAGVGKTRLAVQAAEGVTETFPDGVWFVDLAAAHEPGMVTQAIASVLGAREEGGRSLFESLQEHLRERRLLLVLDNFEQVVAAASLVADLLTVSPGLQALVTSRVPLRLRGEQEVPVLPLPIPSRRRSHLPSLEEVTRSDAVQLFVTRAQAIRPDFALTKESAPTVAEIVARLDGLPLAIELAAARVRLLPPQELLARLDDRLRVLTSGPRDAPTRQQTLRQAIAWSHDLLSPREQTLFRRLAVFASSTTLAAVEAVTDPDGELDVFEPLASLVEGNLVQRIDEASGDARFGMLQSIRAFGLEQLATCGEEARVRTAHARYVGEVVAGARAALSGPEQGSWFDRFETEHDDIRGALRWLMAQREASAALRLAGTMWAFWWIRGYFSEGTDWLAQALDLGESTDPATRALALVGAGTLAEAHGDYGRATEHYYEALALARSHGDNMEAARALTALAVVAQDQGSYDSAARHYDEALLLFRNLRDHVGVAQALVGLGTIAAYRGEGEQAAVLFAEGAQTFSDLGDDRGFGLAKGNLGRLAFFQGDLEQATAHSEQALATVRRLGDHASVAQVLANLGEIAQRRGEMDRAGDLYDEALTHFRELGDKRNIAATQVTLAEVEVAHGDTTRAAALLSESLGLAAELDDKEGMARGLEAFAALADAEGAIQQGVRMLGAAAALREAIGTPLPSVYLEDHERVMDAARGLLGQTELDTTWAAGRALTPEEAVAEARAYAGALIRTRNEHQPSGQPLPQATSAEKHARAEILP